MSAIYLAGPLFSDHERRTNSELACILEQYGYGVFLPQRDGLLLADLMDQGLSMRAASSRIFRRDMEALTRSSCVVAILDGPVVDEGTLVEIGVAIGLGIPVAGITTDFRRSMGFQNPMWREALTELVFDTNRLLEVLNGLALQSTTPNAD
jgi:nucleoside 2-deoxyribosyltransferase